MQAVTAHDPVLGVQGFGGLEFGFMVARIELGLSYARPSANMGSYLSGIEVLLHRFFKALNSGVFAWHEDLGSLLIH